MPRKSEPIVSGQVVLRPASGKRPAGPVTSANVSEVMPSPEAVALARKTFAAEGFDVGPFVANSFSIAGPMRTFDRVFKTRIWRDPETGATKAVLADRSMTYELPLTALPRNVASVIEAVTFTPPPDFGPTSY